MIARLLLHLGIAIVDLDVVARALASNLVRTHDPDILDYTGALRELRREYAIIAIETGLPVSAQAKVADMAWRYVAAARDKPHTEAEGFSFYA